MCESLPTQNWSERLALFGLHCTVYAGGNTVIYSTHPTSSIMFCNTLHSRKSQSTSPLYEHMPLSLPPVVGESFTVWCMWCSMVQCGAYSVVHHGAVWCSVLQCVAVCCSVLQFVAVCSSVLQRVPGVAVCCTCTCAAAHQPSSITQQNCCQHPTI